MARHTPDATGASARPDSARIEPPASGDDAEAWLARTTAQLRAQGCGAVESATLLEIVALGVDYRVSALAAAALELARQMDGRNSATAKSMCAGRLQEALDRLLELHPPQQEATPLDQLKEKRAARLAAAAR